MPALFETSQIGKRQSLANTIAIIEAQATPYSSMAPKLDRPKQQLHQWQVKVYPTTGHRGVVDGLDATIRQSNPRALMQVYGQKTWYLPGVSDFAEETEVAGISKGELAEQIADALVTVKRQIEKRCLSNNDTASDNGTTQGYETRGAFSYIASSAQSVLPVPDGFRTPAAQIYAGALADLREDDENGSNGFLQMAQSSYKQRKGPFKMDAYLGIELKGAFTRFSKWTEVPSGLSNLRLFGNDRSNKALISTIDKLILDTGEVDLHPSSFLYTDADTGADSAFTHKSGIVVDMNMCGLCYWRMPRVVRLPYQGGSHKAIVDAIFHHVMTNVLGAMKLTINS